MVVTASMGVINPLLAKLTMLMGDEYKKLKGVRKQVSFLRDELSAMKALLEKLSLTDDELGPLAKDWRNHVREMAYDMEDCIDDFMHHLGVTSTKKVGFIQKTARHLKKLRVRHRIANQIGELKALVIEAHERRMRYNLDDCKSSSANVPVDPRMSALYKDAASLVGIDGPREELLKWLTDMDQQLKVVSIVGFGGLGKTTLAKAVYDETREQFCCKAFVSVSQRPDIPRLLNSIRLKLGIVVPSQDREVMNIIDKIRDYLKDKRYLVVVDDLWDQTAWDTISCTFPENGKGSRVIVTTRVESVAMFACRNHPDVYRMRPLNSEDSRRLFLNRIFGSEDSCPSQYKEISTEILRKCCGLPLAIITIASLLAIRPKRVREEWESIRNSMGAQLDGKNPTLEGVRQILDLSYKSLPNYLRTCLLYLGTYPEDHNILRDDLVRKWIAEGLVSNLHGRDLEDVAKSYFNELVNRSLVMPGTSIYGEVVSCRVHDMMLDLILSRCVEDNFISVAYGADDVASRLHGDFKVRRLSVFSYSSVYGAADDTTEAGTITASLSQVRSVALFGKFMCRLPVLPFKYLRVLHLNVSVLVVSEHRFGNGFKEIDRVDLTAISQMFQLRYLSVYGSFSDIELPSKIGGLVHLEMLDICKRSSVNIPADIVSLPCLRHLILPRGTMLPECISDMKSLRTLDGISLFGMATKEGLGELTELRELSLYADKWETHQKAAASGSIEDSLCSSFGKLCNLRYLEIETTAFNCFYWGDSRLGSLSHAPPSIERLKLMGWGFSRVPKWINGDLRRLCHLELLVSEISTDEVSRLGDMPSLIHLHLNVGEGQDRSLATINIEFGTGLFPVLESLDLHATLSSMVILPGAMPRLQSLRLCSGEWNWGGATPVGMEHLLSLNQIHVDVCYDNSGGYPPRPQTQSTRASRAFSDAARAHPSRPAFTFKYHPTIREQYWG